MKCPKCHADNTDTARFCSNCATALTGPDKAGPAFTETLETAQEELVTGSVFANRYQVIEELGKGGMGKVYRVLDKKLNEEIALKIIKPDIASDKRTLERFKNELKLARRISQKYIGRLFDLDEEDGVHYITMEYVPGEDLKSLIRRVGQIPVGKSISITKQVCEGLQEAHGIGIVHRDLKPSNIMIDKAGNVRIMDFGIARLIKTKGPTGAGILIGTPEYMSPEQTEAKGVDERSDIYSLGVILYEMTTGRLPFEGETPLSVALKHKAEVPEDPGKLNQHIPFELSRLILSCLEKDPARRLRSAEILIKELTNVEGSLPATDSKPFSAKQTRTGKLTLTLNIRKIGITAFVITAVVLAAIGIGKLHLGRTASLALPPHSSIAILPFTDMSPGLDQEYFCDGMTEEIISRLSQVAAWKVISRTSVMPYKNTTKAIREIGRELDVETVLEGSVRKDRDAIRVTVQLIDVAKDSHLWAGSYDRKLEGIFEIQSDIAENILRELRAELSAGEKKGLRERPTDNLEAYNLYLQGKYYLNNFNTRESLEKAAERFERSVELDPRFALAYAELVMVHARLYVPNTWDHTPERLAFCREALSKALEIAPDRPETRSARGQYLEWIENDFDAALGEYEAALLSLPNDPDLLGNIGSIYLRRGIPEIASTYFERSYERDPNSINQPVMVSWSYALQRKWVEAEIWIDDCIARRPDYGLGYYRKVEIYLYGYGDLERARAVIAKGREHSDSPGFDYWQGMIEYYCRNYKKALEIFDAYTANPSYIAVLKGQILEAMGERDKAKSQYELALQLLGPLIEKRPENAFYYLDRGFAHVGLGHMEEALKWGMKAVEIHPPQTDPYASGEDIYLSLAQIQIMTGKHEEAINKLEYLLSIPSRITIHRLRLDPLFDPLKNNLRFRKLADLKGGMERPA